MFNLLSTWYAKTLAILLIVALIVLILLTYYGLYHVVTFTEKEVGPYTVVYENYVGDYKNVGKTIQSVYDNLTKQENMKIDRCIGIYYDDPATVAKEARRSEGGCILENSYLDKEKVNALIAKGYKIKQIPARNSVVSEFPFKGQMSIMLAVMKVYPKLKIYTKENNLVSKEIMEIYDYKANTISIIMESEKNKN